MNTVPMAAMLDQEFKGVEILVVEDEEDIRVLLANLLRSSGARVTTAADGAEAIQMAATGLYDLLVTDLRMPEMDGMELLRAIRRASPRTRVVLVTAYGGCEEFVEAMSLGADAFVHKPFTVDRILQVIRSALTHAA